LHGEGAPFVQEFPQLIPLDIAPPSAELLADLIEILAEMAQIVH
jgi:hypothetical protein